MLSCFVWYSHVWDLLRRTLALPCPVVCCKSVIYAYCQVACYLLLLLFIARLFCLVVKDLVSCLSYVCVNSNWVHPTPWKNFFERANPGHPGNFLSARGKIFPNSKKLPLKLAKNPQEIQKTTRHCNFLD